MPCLTLLPTADRVKVVVEPKSDTYVYVKPLKAKELSAMRRQFSDIESNEEQQVQFANMLLALSIVDEDNVQMATIDQVEQLPLGIYSLLLDTVLELNGLKKSA